MEICQNSKAIIFSLQGIGNTVLSLPLASAIKRADRSVLVSILIMNARVRKIGIEHPDVDQVIVAEGPMRTLLRLRKEKFDFALFSFPSGSRSYLLAALAGIKCRVGHDIPGRKSMLLTQKIQMLSKKHDLEQNLLLAEAVGAPALADDIWPSLSDIPKTYIGVAKKYLEENDLDTDIKYLGIHTGSDPNFVEKRYAPENYAKVACMIYKKYGLPTIVFDGPSEPGTGVRIARATETPVHTLSGWGSPEDAWGMMAFCELFISNDSGIMNLAEASGVPTLGVFGPSESHRTRPFSGEFIKSDWRCSPCYKLNRYDGCPYRHFYCMDDIDPEQVVKRAERLLGR